jgi:predicted GNAT family acetyltransferase
MGKKFLHLEKDVLLFLLESCDDETKQIFQEDYIPNWDEKHMWFSYPPRCITIDGELASIIFYNYTTHSDYTGEKSLYIQRTYTVPKFRKQGLFRELFNDIWLRSFELNCRSIYLFCDIENWEVWSKLKFIPFMKTKDEKYWFVVAPMLCPMVDDSNTLYMVCYTKSSGPSLAFYTTNFLKFIRGTYEKYC